MKNPKKIAFTSAFIAALAATSFFAISSDDGSKKSTFLFLSDIHIDSRTPDTDYGDDTGMKLWNAFLVKADSVISQNKPDFIVYTGDLPSHIPCCDTIPESIRITHNKDMATILTGLRNVADKHKTPFMYLPGNNDGIAGDYASFADENNKTPLSLVKENGNPYPALNINRSGTKAPYMIDNDSINKGYYSSMLVDSLRLIALNTVIYSPNYNPVDGGNQITDGKNQMTWLSTQLTDAKTAGDKVYIAMHIPPGLDTYGYDKNGYAYNWNKLPQPNNWNDQFLALISQYPETITGILYGHTHMDELRRFYNPKDDSITEVGISCPGVTPNHQNNPGFKLVTYDTESKELLDFTTYYTVPSSVTWSDNSYNFNTIFQYSDKKTMFENVSQDSLGALSKKMDSIYWVMRDIPEALKPRIKYNVEPGISVKTGQ